MVEHVSQQDAAMLCVTILMLLMCVFMCVVVWTLQSSSVWNEYHYYHDAQMFQSNSGQWHTVVMAGSSGSTPSHSNDVAISADFGVTWSLIPYIDFPPRTHVAGAVVNGILWLMGGQNQAAAQLNDVWQSADGGMTFGLAAEQATPFNGKSVMRQWGDSIIVFEENTGSIYKSSFQSEY